MEADQEDKDIVENYLLFRLNAVSMDWQKGKQDYPKKFDSLIVKYVPKSNIYPYPYRFHCLWYLMFPYILHFPSH